MARYLIYLPSTQGQDPALLTAAGLGALVGQPGVSWQARDVLANGPDGGAGILFYWEDLRRPESNVRAGVFPNQEWKAEQGSDPPRFWIGWEKDRRPTPADLERKKMHAGEGVTLCDGNEWIIPIARQLPHVNGIAPGGGFVRRIRREYAAFYEAAEKTHGEFIQSAIDNQGTIEWNFSHCWPFSCAALAQNYLLTPEIIDALELLEDESHYSIAAACTRFPATLDLLCKKKPEAGST